MMVGTIYHHKAGLLSKLLLSSHPLHRIPKRPIKVGDPKFPVQTKGQRDKPKDLRQRLYKFYLAQTIKTVFVVT